MRFRRPSSPLRLSPWSHRLLFSLLILAVAALGMGEGYYLGQRNALVASSRPPASILHPFGTDSQPNQGKQVDFGLFWQAWNTIADKFYGTADPKQQVDGAIAGMVAGLKDPYTFYLPPAENREFQSSLQGSFGGIGAELTVKDDNLTVVSSLDGTPAQKAGIKAQDVILEVDGQKVSDLSFNDAIDKIRGPQGSQVTLTLARSGVEKPFKITLTRETITVKSVTSSSISGPTLAGGATPAPSNTLGNNGEIAYIKVNQFGQDTVDLFRQALQSAKDSGKKGVIVDLRDNPGGFLDSAVQMIGMVIPSHPAGPDQRLKDRLAVVERFKNGSEDDHNSTTSPIVDQLPMVVVVNGGSASASEIFSGAMKDYKRATLVGTKTFGKGSVQELDDLSNGGSIKVTIAKWFTPLGSGIDGKGIEPDVVVSLPDGTQPSTSDPQIGKALEILTQKQ